MYEYVDWMKCKHCKNTNTLFKLRVDYHYKKDTGNIRYKTKQICKLCYLDIERLRSIETREKYPLRYKIYCQNRNKKLLAKNQKKYYKKNRYKINENRRNKNYQIKMERLEVYIT